jgi:hypothetical protein
MREFSHQADAAGLAGTDADAEAGLRIGTETYH